MKLRLKAYTVAMLVAGVACLSVNAAEVTTKFIEKFDGTLDPALTERNGPISVSGGIADLNGEDAAGTAQGYTFDISGENSTSGPTANWIMEAIVPDAVTTSTLDVLLDFSGKVSLRYRNVDSVIYWEMTWKGYNQSTVSTPPSNGDHVALVFYENGTTDRLQYWLNGVLVEDLVVDANESTQDLGGFGLIVFEHASVFAGRGFDGSLDAIAYSTFSGTFNGGFEFALLNPAAGTVISIQ